MKATRAFVLSIAFLPTFSSAECLVPEDGMTIKESVTICAGIHNLPSGIRIGADNIDINGNGATFDGAGGNYTGFGIWNDGYSNITIKNLKAIHYYYGFRSDQGDNIVLDGCSFSYNRLLSNWSIFLNKHQGPEITSEAHLGGGIYIRDSNNPTVIGCTLVKQQNGVDFYDVTNGRVLNSDASYCFGWGIHLNNSSHCLIDKNNARRGNRSCYDSWIDQRCANAGLDPDIGCGCDSAGMLLIASNDNTITHNDFSYGGDGFFGDKGASGENSSDNFIAKNNCSHSPHNGIEFTFCGPNTFEDNVADDCDHGFWLGYSFDSVVVHNTVRHSNHGISIEHGRRNRIEKNTLDENTNNIQLYTNNGVDPRYPDSIYNRDNRVAGNVVTNATQGILVYDWSDDRNRSFGQTITGNIIATNAEGLVFEDNTGSLIYNNDFRNGNNVRESRTTGNPFANKWNIDRTLGTNIIGGPYLGGNYWSNYEGIDLDGDGLGDTNLPYNNGGQVPWGGDVHPLVYINSLAGGGGGAD